MQYKDESLNKYLQHLKESQGVKSNCKVTIMVSWIKKYQSTYGDYYKVKPTYITFAKQQTTSITGRDRSKVGEVDDETLTLTMKGLSVYTSIYKLNVKYLKVNAKIGKRIIDLMKPNYYVTLTADLSKPKSYNNNTYFDISFNTINCDMVKVNYEHEVLKDITPDLLYFYYDDAYYDEDDHTIEVNEHRYSYD